MASSRRDFLKIGGIAAASTAFGARLKAAAGDPALGLIFPPLNYPIPPDARLLYPKGVEFLPGGVGLPGGMTLAGYDEAIPRVLPAAEALAKQGAKVISVFGSSLTFYKGRKFHEELIAKVAASTGAISSRSFASVCRLSCRQTSTSHHSSSVPPGLSSPCTSVPDASSEASSGSICDDGSA